MGPRPIQDWAMLLTLVAVWGTGFLFIDVAVEGVAPLTVAAGRIALAAAVLAVAVTLSGRRWPRGRVWWHFGALAVLGNALPFFLIGWGQERVESSLAGILMGVMPLATLVLAHVFVPGETMTRGKALGFVLGFTGVVVLVGPEALLELGGSPSDLLRQLAVLGGALCYASNAIVARHLPPTDALVASAATLAVATALIAPLAWLADPDLLRGAPEASTGAVVWLGLVTTAAATIVYYRLIASAGPTFFSTINFLIPIVALAAGVVFQAERPGWQAVAALALVLGGLGLSRWDEAGRSPDGA